MTIHEARVPVHQLEQFIPLNTLEPEAFNELSHKLYVESYPKGRRLFVRGQSDNWIYFLLKGEIQLHKPKESPKLLIAGSIEARRPIADEQPREVSALCTTDVEFFRINRNLLELLLKTDTETGYQVEEIGGDKGSADTELLQALLEDYMRDELEIPHFPNIALRVREAVRHPQVSSAKIARILQADPALSARLIQVANSPLYGVASAITTVHHAVNFLGFKTTANLVTSFALKNLFQSASVKTQKQMGKLWVHCATTASFCHVLADDASGLSPDWAMLAGLLHEIGTLPLYHYADRHFRDRLDRDSLTLAIEQLRPTITSLVLRRWGFGNEMVGIVLDAEDWERDPHHQTDYSDIIIAAHLLQKLRGPDPDHPVHHVPALKKVLARALKHHGLQDIVQRVRDDVGGVFRYLK